jgi:hypothetical protein
MMIDLKHLPVARPAEVAAISAEEITRGVGKQRIADSGPSRIRQTAE